jgi:hypothetical protein
MSAFMTLKTVIAWVLSSQGGLANVSPEQLRELQEQLQSIEAHVAGVSAERDGLAQALWAAQQKVTELIKERARGMADALRRDSLLFERAHEALDAQWALGDAQGALQSLRGTLGTTQAALTGAESMVAAASEQLNAANGRFSDLSGRFAANLAEQDRRAVTVVQPKNTGFTLKTKIGIALCGYGLQRIYRAYTLERASGQPVSFGSFCGRIKSLFVGDIRFWAQVLSFGLISKK